MVRVSALCAGSPLPSGRFLVLIFVRGCVDPNVIVQLEGLGQLKKPTELIRNRTHNLPACSFVPQSTMLFPPQWPGFELSSGHVGFVVDEVAQGQVFSEYFGFPCQFSFHRLLHTHHLSSTAGTISQLVAEVPSGLSLNYATTMPKP
jgi:hypothetical protein